MFADMGQEIIWMWQDFPWNFKLLDIYVYEISSGGRGGISLWKQPFLFTPRPLAMFCEEERLWLSVRNSTLMTLIDCT